ncbi:G-protein alpha subunit [Sparassis latifolia]
MGRSLDAEDPLTLAIAPPPNETVEERERRLRDEEEARKVSDRIDEQIKAERAALKKKRPVKVLLLGQSESDFRLTYSADAWAEERASWRAVVQLNLVRNVNMILDMVAEEMSAPSRSAQPDSDVSDDEDAVASPAAVTEPPLRFTNRHALLRLQLAPLSRLQKDLEYVIGAASGEPASLNNLEGPVLPVGARGRHKQEFFIRSHKSWNSQGEADSTIPRKYKEAQARETKEIIASCAEDMRAIWEDPIVQEMLARRRINMEATPGFFLNDLDRIAARDYQPSDDDVVRARLRTLGVQEYNIRFETGPAAGSEWCLYDVGGSRTQRHAWFPYFDDCDAIIFLAPINCFDERLTEDRHVNRLEDSFMLWKAICSSKLLAKTQMVLFLNKCDLLEQKLRAGVKVSEYVRSYGDRANDVQTVSKYFAQHFKEIFRRNSPEPRQFKVHMTSVIDTRATAVTLGIGK